MNDQLKTFEDPAALCTGREACVRGCGGDIGPAPDIIDKVPGNCWTICDDTMLHSNTVNLLKINPLWTQYIKNKQVQIYLI